MKKHSLIFIVFVCFFTSVSFSQQKAEWKGKIEYEDGVKVIRNPQKPLYGEIKFELEEDLRIGNDKDGNYYFYRGFDFCVDIGGNIYIYDNAKQQIQKFDNNGRYIQTIGEIVEELGESRNQIRRLFIDTGGNLFLLKRYEIQKFNSNGVFGRTILLHSDFLNFGVYGNDIFFAQTLDVQPGGRLEGISLFNSRGEKFKTLTRLFIPPPKVPTSYFFYRLNSNRLYSYFSSTGLRIYGLSSKYRLMLVNSSGDIDHIIEKVGQPEKITKEERNNLIESEIMAYKKRGLKISRDELEKESLLMEFKPSIIGLLIDDTGNIYVRKIYSLIPRDKKVSFDLFNKDGYFLYEVKLPIILEFPIPKLIIADGFIYQRDYDREAKIHSLVRYKIKNWDQIKEGIE